MHCSSRRELQWSLAPGTLSNEIWNKLPNKKHTFNKQVLKTSKTIRKNQTPIWGPSPLAIPFAYIEMHCVPFTEPLLTLLVQTQMSKQGVFTKNTNTFYLNFRKFANFSYSEKLRKLPKIISFQDLRVFAGFCGCFAVFCGCFAGNFGCGKSEK